MVLLRYLLIFAGIALLAGAATILAWDLYQILRLRRKAPGELGELTAPLLRRMKLEAAILKENPLLIRKIIAERLSDKVQIMMAPNDGKFFVANDVLKGMTTAPETVH